jgi:RHS repeat-associated protein
VERERLAREQDLGTTFYGWDGDTLAWETTNERSTHYFYEPDSFIPLAQAVKNRPMQMHPTPDWSNRDYKVKDDPLWTQVLEPEPFDKLGFYHCDHLGTPQEITDEEGNIAWSAQYKAWGEAKELLNRTAQKAGFKNPLRFQGQYFDHETGLHYNRFRYYDPETGRFISKDPIGFFGNLNVFQYAQNPTEWIDPLGLKSSNKKTAKDNCCDDECDATSSSHWARREVLRKMNMPIGTTHPKERRGVPPYEQFLYIVGGKKIIVSHHPKDEEHKCPHWHGAVAKEDDQGNILTFSNKAWKYENRGKVTVEHKQ